MAENRKIPLFEVVEGLERSVSKKGRLVIDPITKKKYIIDDKVAYKKLEMVFLGKIKHMPKDDKIRAWWIWKKMNGLATNSLKGKNYRQIYKSKRLAEEQTKKRLSSLSKKCAEGTLPEAIMAEILDQLNVNYERYKPIEKFIVDFYLSQTNSIIECDGDYWHRRQDMTERDERKDKFLRSLGFTVLRFWESEIKENKENVINEIRKFVG